MNMRKVFATLLSLSGLITSLLGLRTLLDTPGMMRSFGVSLPPAVDLSLLIAVLGAAILSLGLFQLLAASWSWFDRAEGRSLGLFCAASLLLVAVCAFAMAGSREVLLLDGIRGSLLLITGLLWKNDR